MTERIFNTVFETSLRIVILLDQSGHDLDAESIQAADFMATYGKDFSLSKDSANGENPFKYCELSARKSLTEAALRKLVLDGSVLPTASDNGFFYRTTMKGHRLSASLTSEYSREYRDAVSLALDTIERDGIKTVVGAIRENSLAAQMMGLRDE